MATEKSVYPTPGSADAKAGYIKTTDNSGRTDTSTTNTTMNSGSKSTTTDNSTGTNMDPTSLKALQALIKALQSGGTTEQKGSSADRARVLATTEGLMPQVSTAQAFEDAKGMMALNLQQSMEKNMPSIQRAIEGAGTSTSSMQGLLSQKLATDSALNASALGGDQAKAYAAQRTGIAAVLEALTRPNDSVTKSLLEALQIAKGATTSSNRTITEDKTGYQNTVADNVTNVGGFTTTETVNPTAPASDPSGVGGDYTPVLRRYTADSTNGFYG